MPKEIARGGPRWLSRITRHRLTFMDRIAFERYRRTGRNQLMQCLWLYDTKVDVDALQGMCDRIRTMRLYRLIEPSAVPFGRPRWVRDDRSPLPVRIGETVLPRTALTARANAHARTPMNPATGPASRIGLQRFSDGTSAVSMVGSHVQFDGLFALNTVRRAIAKPPSAASYRARGERGRIAGGCADLGQALLDVPRTLKALSALAALVVPRRRSAEPAAPVAAPVRPAEADRVVEMPGATTATRVNQFFRYDADRPVTCSNLGELPSQLGAADGTPRRTRLVRAVDVRVTVDELVRTDGHLLMVSSRHNGVLSICIEAYQPGAENSAERLRDIAIKTLEEFGLKGTVEC